jgi:hypothetical protein
VMPWDYYSDTIILNILNLDGVEKAYWQ